jgi:ABC-type nitrate/sulfonate/bicarbonate transport system substrate-binding protein
MMAGGGLASCGRAPTKVDSITIANAAGGSNLTMAALIRQEGFLESFGLQSEILTVADGSKILGGIVSGSVDASFMSGFGQAFPAIARGAKVKIIGGGALLPSLALFTSKPQITRLKDLEGRTVGSGSVGALTYQLTVTLLRKHGVDVSKISFVNIGSSADVFRAVSAGTIDAGVGPVAQAQTAAARGMNIIANGNMALELKDFTFQGAWTTSDTISERRDILVKALAAYGALYRFVQNPASKGAFIKARSGVFSSAPLADHEAEWAYIQRYKPFAVNLALSRERIDYIQRLNVEFGLQNSVLPFERVADMSLARDALALLERG